MDASPAGMVLLLFGASGDLTRRKLIPTLFSLCKQDLLPPRCLVIGFARSPMDTEAFRRTLTRAHPRAAPDDPQWTRFLQRIQYVYGPYEDERTYQRLGRLAGAFARQCPGDPLHLFYLATPPAAFPAIGAALGRYRDAYFGHTRNVRIAIEKPFGRDHASAQALNACFRRSFAEPCLFRIDHYLGKETVQNILFLRFANGIFEPIWNRNYIDHFQITVAEELLLEGRAGYYEQAGALRDMVQNHLLQLLCLTTMEPPTSLDAEAIRDQKVNILRSVPVPRPEEVLRNTVRGQYAAGTLQGQRVRGYLDEAEIPAASRTETYVAWKLEIDNWRWQGVPFYVRTGKGLPRKATEIVIQFRRAPHLLFKERAAAERMQSNMMRLRLQPNEGIELGIGVKRPGPAFRIAPVLLDFAYQDAFGPDVRDAYERLWSDLIAGDGTLFTRADEAEAAWTHITHILDVWRAADARSAARLPQYAPGTWGPDAGADLIQRDGRRWQTR